MAGLTYGSELQKKTAVRSFWNGFYEMPNPFDGLFSVRSSDQITDTYARLGAAPFPDEWIGDKNVKDVNEYSKTVTNRAYESAIGIGKEFQKFDLLDEIASVTRNLGQKAAAHKVKLASELIEAGVAGTIDTAEDGQFFFDADHKNAGAENQTNQSNDLVTTVVSTTVPTDLEFATSVRNARQQFYTFKDDRGDPTVPSGSLDASNLVCMIPPGYMSVAERVASTDQLTGPLGNDVKGKFEVRVNPFLSATSSLPHIFFFYTGSDRKPIIIQEASGLEFQNELNILNGSMIFTTEWWGRVIYGEWRTGIIDVLST